MEVPTIRGSEGKGTPKVHTRQLPTRAMSGPDNQTADERQTSQHTVPIQSADSGSQTHGLTMPANDVPTIN